ncbi:Uncharacterised protein [Vibrio cholerae]|nr:Uncharacterised protein [Vibrio cholerae]CSI55017.1 Uncharacterised protein [Vibrio cholerae]
MVRNSVKFAESSVSGCQPIISISAAHLSNSGQYCAFGMVFRSTLIPIFDNIADAACAIFSSFT